MNDQIGQKSSNGADEIIQEVRDAAKRRANPREVGDYLDVEGQPFVIKRILPNRRVLLKQADEWPADAEDWRKTDRKMRRARADICRVLRELLDDGRQVLILDRQFFEEILLPALEA